MTALIGRMLPLLSKFVPAGLAIKGLSKINPRLANFATSSLSAGYGADQIVDYLRERVSPSGNLNEIQRLKSGEARGSLRSDEKRSLAKRKQSEVGKNIATTAIGLGTGLLNMGGGNEQQQPIQQPPMARNDMEAQMGPPQSMLKPQEIERRSALKKFNQGAQMTPQEAQQGNQGGPGQQALIAMLQKINQRLGQ